MEREQFSSPSGAPPALPLSGVVYHVYESRIDPRYADTTPTGMLIVGLPAWYSIPVPSQHDTHSSSFQLFNLHIQYVPRCATVPNLLYKWPIHIFRKLGGTSMYCILYVLYTIQYAFPTRGDGKERERWGVTTYLYAPRSV